MQLLLSQVCSLDSDFQTDIEEYSAGKCPGVEIWMTKLETFLKERSVSDACKLLEDQHMTAPVASFQGGLLTSQGDARQASWDLFRKRLLICQQMAIPTIVVAADCLPPIDQDAVDRATSSLVEIAKLAESHAVSVALEFQARSAFINNLQTAAAVVADVGSDNLGLCLDLFHFSVGPSKMSDLGLVTSDNLKHVQLCDLLDVPREFATDADRILPGEGDIPLQPIVQRLEEIGYGGSVSIELMNPQVWQVPPRQFGEIGITALRKILGKNEN